MCGTDYALTKVYTFHLHSRWFFYQDKKTVLLFNRTGTYTIYPWYHLNYRIFCGHSHRLTHGKRLPYLLTGSGRCSEVLFTQALICGFHCPALTLNEISCYFSSSWHLSWTHYITSSQKSQDVAVFYTDNTACAGLENTFLSFPTNTMGFLWLIELKNA